MPSVVANDRESTHEAHRPHYTILNHVDCVSWECQFTADVCSFLSAQGSDWQEERLTVQTRDEGSIRFELYAGNAWRGNIALDDIVLQYGSCGAIDVGKCVSNQGSRVTLGETLGRNVWLMAIHCNTNILVCGSLNTNQKQRLSNKNMCIDTELNGVGTTSGNAQKDLQRVAES